MSIQSTTPITNISDTFTKIIIGLGGNTISLYGFSSTIGVMTSYTPATGKRFSPLKYSVYLDTNHSIATTLVMLRNNGNVVDQFQIPRTASVEDIAVGDVLVGDGTKTYDIYLDTTPFVPYVFALIHGIIF